MKGDIFFMENDVEQQELTPEEEPGLEESEQDLFSRLIADWRNIALLIVTIIAVVLLALRLTAGAGGNQVLAMVSGKPILEKDLVSELKHQRGDQMLMEMISEDVIQDYAAQQKITTSESEIDQFLNYKNAQLEMGSEGQTLDEYLKAHQQSLADYRKGVRLGILQMKLIVPETDIKAELAKPDAQYDLPKRYQFHDYQFLTEDLATGLCPASKNRRRIRKALPWSTIRPRHSISSRSPPIPSRCNTPSSMPS